MEWIDLKDKKPAEMQVVIAYQNNKQDHFTQFILCYHNGQFREYDGDKTATLSDGDYPDITHWMPRQSPPNNNPKL